MPQPNKALARALDVDLIEVAKKEDRSIGDLVKEVTQLTGYSARHIYNWRSALWPIPSNVIPILCKRFNSTALLDALTAEMKDIEEVEIPDRFDLADLVTTILRSVCNHHFNLMEAFRRPGGIDAETLKSLDIATEDVIRQERQLFAIARAEHERTAALKQKQA